MTSRNAPQVLSMGEILVDLIVDDGAASLASAGSFAARAGGAPANVAVALARLEVPAAFCGVVGDDPFGERLSLELRQQNVDARRLRRTDQQATTLAFAWKDDRGDGHFWLLRGADTLLDPSDAEQAGIPDLAALVVGSVSLAAAPPREAIRRAVALAAASAVPVVFDVNLRPTVWGNPNDARPLCEEIARVSRLVKLSLDDARGLYGDAIDPAAAVTQFLGNESPFVVLTDGERGCWFATRERPGPCFVPAFHVTAIEPTGAGDAFLAALVDRLLQSKWERLTEEDVRAAAAAGALAVTKQGAWDGLPDHRLLRRFLSAQ